MQNKNWVKNVAIFLLSQSVSIFGSSIVGYAIVWYITLSTSSSLMLTISILCTYLPQAMISVLTGVIADRYDRKLLIMLGDAITAFTTLIAYIAFTLGNPSYIAIFIVCSLRSVGAGIQNPVENAFLPSICPKEKLPRANSLNATFNSAITILAPGIGGLCLATLGFTITLLIDVITAMIAIVLMLFIKCDYNVRNEKLSISELTSFISNDFKEGVNFIKSHNILSNLVIFYFVFYFFMSVPAFLTPMLVERSFGSDVWRLTASETFWSLGTLIGGVIIFFWGGFKNRLKSMTLASAFFGFEIILLGIVSNFYIYLFIMVLAGIFLPIVTTSNILLIQESVPDELLGRVFSNIQILSSFAIPAGIIIFGPLGDYVSIENLLIFTGLCIFVVSYLIFKVDKRTSKT